MDPFMKMWYVEYITKDNQRIGMQISARTSLDAKMFAEKLPNYARMFNYPQQVG